MRKLLSVISIALILNNVFILSVFASVNINLSYFGIKRNGGKAINTDIEVFPGDKLSFIMSSVNKGDDISNVSSSFTFSSTDFQYINEGQSDFYRNGYIETENIGTEIFNPPLDNSVFLTNSATFNDSLAFYEFDIQLNQNISETIITTSAEIKSNEGNSNKQTRNIFVNSRPHIIDYYFEKNNSVVTQISRGGEKIDLVLKIKDYNGCEDIDDAAVKTNLTNIGLTSSEALSFISCDSEIATYKKTEISTEILPTTVSFSSGDFSVLDETGNINKINDSETTFDNEDKKTSLSLVVASAGVPSLSSTITDNIIGSNLNDSTIISYSGDQNGEISISIGSDSNCLGGTVLLDWQTYTSSINLDYILNTESLSEGDNNIYICLKNDESKIGSINLNVKKDIDSPIISSTSLSPVNIVNENSRASFICSEKGTYKIEKGGNGTFNSGVDLYSGVVVAGIENNITINNADLGLNSNDLYIYCFDEALNNVSNYVIVTKTTPPPSFSSETVTFEDNDIDFDGLDGRDLSFSWNSNIGENYDYFGSYLLYVLPDNIVLDTDIHRNIKIVTDVTENSFLGIESIINDSLGNGFVSNSNYKMCILINGTNGLLGEEKCSDSVKLISDAALHPKIISAKFITDTILEIRTDTLLDENINSHSGGLINFEVNGTIYSGISVNSIDGKKIKINIDNLGSTDVSGINLLLLGGGLRAGTGGFNEEETIGNIIDGQNPVISSIINNTPSVSNNFYTGPINFGFTFGEQMLTSETKFEISRISGNTDSTTHYFSLTGPELLKGTHNQYINLDDLDLVSGTSYEIRLVGKDLAGNYSSTNHISNIKYDFIGADIINQNVFNLYSTLTPELTWNIPSDNNGNGSGIKKYNIDIYSGNECIIGNKIQTLTSTTNTKTIDTVANVANYSWKVNSEDNMGNIGIESICSNFVVDTSVPTYGNPEIKDLNTNSLFFIKENNVIEVSLEINDTDINHIWLDVSALTGNAANNNELCSSPSSGITCSYIGNIAKYSFSAGSTIIDGVKQVIFNSQNTSGGNDAGKIISTTADSNSPSIESGTFLSPSGKIGGTGALIKWDQSKIIDTIGVDFIQTEYSIGNGVWSLIGTGANIGSMYWDLSSLNSEIDYKVKISAIDEAGNSSSIESNLFEIDRTNPAVESNTITGPNGGEIFGNGGSKIITWNAGNISDSSLSVNPIEISYSNDGGITWNIIESNLPNNGSYDWSYGNINNANILIKITAYDEVGNFSSDESDSSFIIDVIKPEISLDFSTTPVNGEYINNSGIDILGNTADIYFKESLYSFKNLTTQEYFNGTSFSGTIEKYNNICSDSVTKGSSNSCNLISFNLLSSIVDGNNYRLQLISIDEALNEALSIPVDYIGDVVNPNITINTSDGSFFKDGINISGISSDLGSGISSVKIQIKKGNTYWNGSSFVGDIQTLNTNTNNNYGTWDYDLLFSGDDGEYEITAIAYDKSFKVNNKSETSIKINKDTTVPSITGGTNLFTSPLDGEIYIGGNNVNISWNNGSIIDNGSLLKENPIKLEYFNGTEWGNISVNEINDGSFVWTSGFFDSDNIKIRLSATDNVGNIAYQNSSNFIIDSTSPTISSIETMDLDANGEIDGLNIIMSEKIQDSSIILTDFDISNSIGHPTSFETGNIPNDNNFILKFNNNGNTSLKPSLSYTKGDLVDIAGKFLETDNYTLSLDKAVPRALSSKIQDTNSNGKFDKIIIKFSENLDPLSDTSIWFINNKLDGISIDNSSVDGNNVILELTESIDFDTSVGSMELNLNANGNIVDVNGNRAGSINGLSMSDEAEPIIYKTEYFDEDGNYKVDKVEITLSENVLGFIESDFNITGLNQLSGNIDNNKISFNIDETNLDNDTGVISDFSFMGGNLRDLSNNFIDSVSNISIDDKVAPKLLSQFTNDINGNAKIDSIVLKYSEILQSDFSGFVSEIEGYNVSGYIKGKNNQIIVNVEEKDTYDGGEIPSIKIILNDSLLDANGNFVEQFDYISTEDKVGPVIIGARYDIASHKIFINSSENIKSGDFTIENIILKDAGSYSIISSDINENSITLSGENISYGITEITFKGNSVEDILGNKQEGNNYIQISPPIIINEVMLSNNSNNNYVELRNLSDSIVDISHFTIGEVIIPSNTNISANGYYLISKTNINTSLLNVIPNLVSDDLNISGSILVLNNSIIDIDFARLNTTLFDIDAPKSVERKDKGGNGLLISNWYTAQTSIGFDNDIAFGTPGITNIFDATSPTITSSTPEENTLLSIGKLDISFDYIDDIGGLGIDINSDDILLKKWNGNAWGTDIASTYIDLDGKEVTSTKAIYGANNLNYGKYKIDFEISDIAGNNVTKSIIFFVDEFTFDLNVNSIDIGNLQSDGNTFSITEAILIIETVGAGFSIDILKNGLLTNNGTDIVDFDGVNGFGYDKYNNGYSGNITSIGNGIQIDNKNIDININGDKYTYIYKVKFGAKINTMQGAGVYIVKPTIEILTNY